MAAGEPSLTHYLLLRTKCILTNTCASSLPRAGNSVPPCHEVLLKVLVCTAQPVDWVIPPRVGSSSRGFGNAGQDNLCRTNRKSCQAGGVLLHKRHVVLVMMSRTSSILQKTVLMFTDRYQGCIAPGGVEIQEGKEPAPNVTDPYFTGGKTSPKRAG